MHNVRENEYLGIFKCLIRSRIQSDAWENHRRNASAKECF